jgi:hypothetical protein
MTGGEPPRDAPLEPPPPPAPPPAAWLAFDGSFVGPLLPPLPPSRPDPAGAPALASAAVPVVSDAVLAIPLGTRRLIATSLDLLTRPDAGLRSASFYIGLVVLLTVGPAVVLLALAWLTLGDAAFAPSIEPRPWAGWLGLAAIPAGLGYLAASVDARALASAVIGGRAEGRPLRLRESIAVVRRRFWRVLAAQVLVGIVTSIASFVASQVVDGVIGTVDAVDFGVSLLVGVVAGAPFVYVTAGIVIGEVGVLESIRRSIRLVVARRQLAVVVAAFTVLSQFIVVLGLSVGLDAVARIAIGAGLQDAFPAALAIPIGAALVFALGTLVFLVEAIAAAPAVYAFAALTHYTRGLELGRREPLRARHAWDPWITPGLAAGAAIALLGLLGGILSLPS